MSHIKAVIFDCDGVLFESQGANLAFYNRMFKHFGYEEVTSADSEKAHFCHIATSSVVVQTLMREEHHEAAMTFLDQLDFCEFIPYMVPEPHLYEVLEQLQNEFVLGVATNRGRSIVPVLEQFKLREYFSVVVNSHDVENPKPAPDMLLLAVERLGADCSEAVFIGDSVYDRRAAEGAKTAFIGYGPLSEGEVAVSSHLALRECITRLSTQ